MKVLDFGLAKLSESAGSAQQAAGSVSMSPTQSMQATMAGIILGTAAYMSPEQARSGSVDRRADLVGAWGGALRDAHGTRGCSMGPRCRITLAQVLMTDPDWARFLRKRLRRSAGCFGVALEKDRKRRLDSAAAARLEMDEALAPASGDARVVSGAGVGVLPTGWRRALPWALLEAHSRWLAIVVAIWAPWRVVPSPAPVQVSAELGADTSLVTDQGAAAVLSPDGGLFGLRRAEERGQQ